MPANHAVFPIILAGGQSSRLFPFNKVLSDLTGSGQSLIQQAVRRLGTKDVYVLTVEEMVRPIYKQLGLARSRCFVDPVRRGTWPALLWAMAHLRHKNPNGVMGVVTADHVIPNVKEFQKAFRQGVERASDQAAFVVIPVTPNLKPESWTSFGAVKGDPSGRMLGFEEKPTLDRARQMIQEGGWYWNAGMFFFKISVAEKVLQIFQPEMHRIYVAIAEALKKGKTKTAARLFESFPNKIPHPLIPSRLVDNSIDYAVMTPLVFQATPAATAYVTSQALTRWTDLGQWTALRQVVKPDRHGNVLIGDVKVGQNVKNSILVAGHRHRIEVSDVDHMVVALAGGKALVLPESDIARVKDLVTAQGSKSIIGEPLSIGSFNLFERRNVVILSNRLKEGI